MFRTVLLIAWSVLALGTAWAQDGVPSSSADIVSAQAYPSLEPIPWHGDFQIAVQIKIKDGWHINGRDGLPEGFIPLDVSLAKFTNLELAGPIQYPAGNLKTLGGETKPFPVYENEARVIIPVRLRGAPKPMILDEGLVLKVQACNDQFCLRPSEVPVTVRVHLAAVGETPRPVNAEMFTPAAAGGPPALPSDNIIVRLFQEKGVLLTFLLVFLGGLALNLTPCVYPMIPITVSYFGTQRAEKPLVVLGRALAYVVGISVTYSSLGVTAALTGRILGSTLQSPWVLGGISLLLVILSLSMFGLYGIQAPSWLLNKVAAGNTQGWIGALGMGLVLRHRGRALRGPLLHRTTYLRGGQGEPISWLHPILHPLPGPGVPVSLAGFLFHRAPTPAQVGDVDGLGEKSFRDDPAGDAALFPQSAFAQGLQPLPGPRLFGLLRVAPGLGIFWRGSEPGVQEIPTSFRGPAGHPGTDGLSELAPGLGTAVPGL